MVRERALDALNRMRAEGLSLTRAAQAARTKPGTVLKYVGRALVKTPAGRYAATPSDRLMRYIRILTETGPLEIAVRGSRPASRVARYMAAVDRYLRDGSTEDLREFDGQTIRARKDTYTFLTDPEALDRLADANEVSIERLYSLRA